MNLIHDKLSLTLQKAFLIGSIDEINKRISNLDRKLQSYTELVVESRASDRTEDLQDLMRPPSTEGHELYQKRGEFIIPVSALVIWI